jgi:glycosyltransferase involved in cell wall biosynthesis
MNVSLIIPALNEAACLGPLLAEIPPGLVQQLIVVDNGSSDGTADVARKSGAQVVIEPRRGYGAACAAGVAIATGDIVAFMDGDGSFVPAELVDLLEPVAGGAPFVLGTRSHDRMTVGAMPAHQAFGNRLVTHLMRLLYRIELTDLGPFRVIQRDALLAMQMQEMTYGWPVEMIVKAARMHLPMQEISVSYRRRSAGQSKVGGTLRGTVLAGYRILRTTFRYAIPSQRRADKKAIL